MYKNQSAGKIAELVHEKSVEILKEVGFCVPDEGVLSRLNSAGFAVDKATEMVRIPQDYFEKALTSLPKDIRLYHRDREKVEVFDRGPLFMGAGTPVNVLDLEEGGRRTATWQDVRQLVTLQDALSQVDVVRPTVTATDVGTCSDWSKLPSSCA